MAHSSSLSYLFNPGNMTAQQLIDRFVVRKGLLAQLLSELENTDTGKPPQHVLIQGLRGSGKTTTLLRVAYEIQRTPQLSQKLLPVTFSEELYRVRRLHHLWVMTLEQLPDEAASEKALAELEQAESPRDAALPILLAYLGRIDKQVVLFFENLEAILSKFTRNEQQRLREVLMSCGNIRFMASTVLIPETMEDYKEPFYGFFKVYSLEGLGQKDTMMLMETLARVHHREDLLDLFHEKRGQLEALRRLTGGLPRTLVILFEVFADSRSGDSVSNLEMYLDRVTPLYKHILDELGSQYQAIVHALGIAWDPAPVRQIAAAAELESKNVSSLLKKLLSLNMVDMVRTGGKNHLYYLSDRFMNIWYLMRFGGKRGRQRVIWLVRFLESWCDQQMLEERAKQHIRALEFPGYNPSHAYLMTQALAHTGKLDHDLEEELLDCTRAFLKDRDPQLMSDLSESDKDLVEKARNLFKSKKYFESIGLLKKIKNKTLSVLGDLGLCYVMTCDDEQFQKLCGQLQKLKEPLAYNYLGVLYSLKRRTEEAIKYFEVAAESEEINSIANIARIYLSSERRNRKKAKHYLEKMIRIDTAFSSGWAQFQLAKIYNLDASTSGKDIQLLQESIDYDYPPAYNLLGMSYLKDNDVQKAIEIFTKAKGKGIKLEPVFEGLCYVAHKDFERAAQCFKKSYMQGFSPARMLYNGVLLAQNQFDESTTLLLEYLNGGGTDLDLIAQHLRQMLRFRLYQTALELFENPVYQLSEKLKPTYFALLHLMNDTAKLANIPPELEQTVQEIVADIKEQQEAMRKLGTKNSTNAQSA